MMSPALPCVMFFEICEEETKNCIPCIIGVYLTGGSKMKHKYVSLMLAIIFIFANAFVAYGETYQFERTWQLLPSEYIGSWTADAAGNIYLVACNDNRIEKFDSNGNFLTQWGSNGTGNGQFGFPSGIAVDAAGNVYIADKLNCRIQKFDSNGNYLTQ